MTINPESKTKSTVWVVEDGKINSRSDQIATEEPLEIRLIAGEMRRTIAITMRTPGHDFDLAAGFLFTEGIINSRLDIRRLNHCIDRNLKSENRYNIINVELTQDTLPELSTLERHFFTTSACGVCGKNSLESLHLRGCDMIPNNWQISAEIFTQFPDKLRDSQRIFSSTGGLHAAALFNRQGELLTVREDVGRHNALDKLIGSALLSNELPLNNCIVLVSGRASFELLQKSLTAKVPIVCAVSAPSSLAVQLAQEFNITLIGFLRGKRYNIYSGLERIKIQ